MKEVIISQNSNFRREIGSNLAHKFLTEKGIEHYIYADGFDTKLNKIIRTKHDYKEDLAKFWYVILDNDVGDEVTEENLDYKHIYIEDFENIREDPILIKLVREEASLDLHVVIIPDVEYYVQDFDMGGEMIHQTHSTWS